MLYCFRQSVSFVSGPEQSRYGEMLPVAVAGQPPMRVFMTFQSFWSAEAVLLIAN